MYAFMELFVVLAFAAGWLVLEYVGRRLDRQKEARERDTHAPQERDSRARSE
jgi:hypothetical protein